MNTYIQQNEWRQNLNNKKMKIITIIVLSLILSASMLFVGAPTTAQAASKETKNAKAHVAYTKWHMKNWNKSAADNGTLAVCYFDINKDGVDEMIANYESDVNGYVVYTYYKGKMKKLDTFAGSSSGSLSFWQAKGILVSTSNTAGFAEHYYKMSSSKLTLLARCSYRNGAIDGPPYQYEINGKETTKLEYDVYVKALKKGKKVNLATLSEHYAAGKKQEPLGIVDYVSKRVATYYIAVTGDKFKSKDKFYLAKNVNIVNSGLFVSPNNYTKKATFTLCNSKKKAISKPVSVSGDMPWKEVSYNLVKDRVYYFKIKTINNQYSGSKYYSNVAIEYYR